MIEPKNVKINLFINDFFCRSQDKKLFKFLDKQIVKQRFYDVSSLSSDENILNLSAACMTNDELITIVKKFIITKNVTTNCSSRSIFEVIKISNLPAARLSRTFSSEQLLSLCDKLLNVSHETNLISYEFMALHIVRNLIIKNVCPQIKKDLCVVKKKICLNLTRKEYIPENKNKPNTYLCWIDTVFNLIMNDDLSADNYMLICNKIINLTNFSTDVLWKISTATALLLQDSRFCDVSSLRNFRRNIQKKALSICSSYTYKQEGITFLLIKTLAKNTINKEDYYHLFAYLKDFSKNNLDDHLYCIRLFYYIFYRQQAKNIFSYRHIRENFLNTLFEIICNNCNTDANTQSFLFLCCLLADKEHFELHKNDIFGNALDLLKKISNDTTNVTSQKFYKYCGLLDYLGRENHIATDYFADILSNTYRQVKQIEKHLKGTKFKYSV